MEITQFENELTNNKANISLISQVIEATENFTKILYIDEIKEKYPRLWWGGNGVGNRWANRKFNYSVIFNKKVSVYSENEYENIDIDLLNDFKKTINKSTNGIIGIFVHSIRMNNQTRTINKDISIQIRSTACVICGTSNTIVDHKNDLYNDIRILCTKTQQLNDFQPLCNHCNLQKIKLKLK